MNILENYITEIHSVKPYKAEWTSEFPDREFVEVDITKNCYGCIKRETHVWTTAELELNKARGYYWA